MSSRVRGRRAHDEWRRGLAFRHTLRASDAHTQPRAAPASQPLLPCRCSWRAEEGEGTGLHCGGVDLSHMVACLVAHLAESDDALHKHASFN